MNRRATTARPAHALFGGLRPSGPDGKLSEAYTKPFTRFGRKVLGERDDVDFQSLRRRVATYAEPADLHPTLIAELMGHTTPTLGDAGAQRRAPARSPPAGR